MDNLPLEVISHFYTVFPLGVYVKLRELNHTWKKIADDLSFTNLFKNYQTPKYEDLSYLMIQLMNREFNIDGNLIPLVSSLVATARKLPSSSVKRFNFIFRMNKFVYFYRAFSFNLKIQYNITFIEKLFELTYEELLFSTSHKSRVLKELPFVKRMIEDIIGHTLINFRNAEISLTTTLDGIRKRLLAIYEPDLACCDEAIVYIQYLNKLVKQKKFWISKPIKV
jgi:hypothetical protein